MKRKWEDHQIKAAENAYNANPGGVCGNCGYKFDLDKTKNQEEDYILVVCSDCGKTNILSMLAYRTDIV